MMCRGAMKVFEINNADTGLQIIIVSVTRW